MQYKISSNISEKQIQQLIFFSNNDSIVINNTHDSDRFKNIECFKKWLKLDTKIFTLSNKHDDLLGIIWIEPLECDYSKYKHTFAIRLYGEARGKGFSYTFAQKGRWHRLYLMCNKHPHLDHYLQHLEYHTL